MSEQDNLAIVQAAYEAFGRGDMPALLSRIAPDVEWVFPGPSAIPCAGTFRGHAGVLQFLGHLADLAEFEVYQPRHFLVSGDLVVVLGFARARIRRNGTTNEAHWAHAFTLSGGKVTHFREYIDTAGIVASLAN